MAERNSDIVLPPPTIHVKSSLQHALRHRRSVREYQDSPLSLAEIGQLLWAAQGVTHSGGKRTAPSAGALYPLELFLVVGQVEDLAEGVYHYKPTHHRLELIRVGDQRRAMANVALFQSWMKEAAAIVVVTAVYQRTTGKYGRRGRRYVHIEVGHAAQNLYLQAEALGLGTVAVGAFTDEEVAEVLELADKMEPLLLMPVGRK